MKWLCAGFCMVFFYRNPFGFKIHIKTRWKRNQRKKKPLKHKLKPVIKQIFMIMLQMLRLNFMHLSSSPAATQFRPAQILPNQPKGNQSNWEMFASKWMVIFTFFPLNLTLLELILARHILTSDYRYSFHFSKSEAEVCCTFC